MKAQPYFTHKNECLSEICQPRVPTMSTHSEEAKNRKREGRERNQHHIRCKPGSQDKCCSNEEDVLELWLGKHFFYLLYSVERATQIHNKH